MIETLKNAFTQLPGVGQKTARRFTYHLLQRNRDGGIALAEALINAMSEVKECSSCRNLTQNALCSICSNPKRDQQKLCIVESPTDILLIEQSQSYQGLYFVLSGYLSPIDGIGAEELGLNKLKDIFEKTKISELILATNATLEGEITADYIKNMADRFDVKTTRLAHGIPLGGELEYIDSHTLAHAFKGRNDYE
jgi:recombination protein RecR